MKVSPRSAIIGAAILTIAGLGVVLEGRDTAPSHPDVPAHDAADDAIEQLLRLDARFKAGISLMTYSEGLAEVLYAVDSFDASGQASSMPQVAVMIGQARSHYEWVGRIWPMKLGPQGRAVWDVPDDADSARFFGPTPDASRAAAQEVRDWALARGSGYGPDLDGYIDQLAARVLGRGGDLARVARRELQALVSGN